MTCKLRIRTESKERRKGITRRNTGGIREKEIHRQIKERTQRKGEIDEDRERERRERQT